MWTRQRHRCAFPQGAHDWLLASGLMRHVVLLYASLDIAPRFPCLDLLCKLNSWHHFAPHRMIPISPTLQYSLFMPFDDYVQVIEIFPNLSDWYPFWVATATTRNSAPSLRYLLANYLISMLGLTILFLLAPLFEFPSSSAPVRKKTGDSRRK